MAGIQEPTYEQRRRSRHAPDDNVCEPSTQKKERKQMEFTINEERSAIGGAQ
jgi:hypothetical protein